MEGTLGPCLLHISHSLYGQLEISKRKFYSGRVHSHEPEALENIDNWNSIKEKSVMNMEQVPSNPPWNILAALSDMYMLLYGQRVLRWVMNWGVRLLIC